MTDENKKKQSPNAPAKEKPAETGEKATEDYKAKYEALQGEHQKAVEQLKSAQNTIDTLDQYGAINWDKISGTAKAEGPAPPAPGTEPDEAQVFKTALQRQEGKILMLQFRLDHPDLREYEDDLVAPFVIRARQKHPRKAQDAILKIAADDVRGFLQKHADAVIERQKATQAKEDAEKASGLESGGTTTPENVVDDGEARQRYVAHRRKRQAQQMGKV